MRRLLFIIIGLIVVLFVFLVVVFGLKSPEMPIQEVHKVLSITKMQTTAPPLPVISMPNVPAGSTQQGVAQLPPVPQPGSVPASPAPVAPSQGNVAQPPVNGQVMGPASVPASNPPAVVPSQGNIQQGVAQQNQAVPAVNAPQAPPVIIPSQGNNQTGINPQTPVSAVPQGQNQSVAPQQLPAVPQPGNVPGNALGSVPGAALQPVQPVNR